MVLPGMCSLRGYWISVRLGQHTLVQSTFLAVRTWKLDLFLRTLFLAVTCSVPCVAWVFLGDDFISTFSALLAASVDPREGGPRIVLLALGNASLFLLPRFWQFVVRCVCRLWDILGMTSGKCPTLSASHGLTGVTRTCQSTEFF